MHDTNTARCLYSDDTQDPADTLVTQPVNADVGDTQEQPQEDLDGRIRLLRQQVLGSSAPESSIPEEDHGLRRARPDHHQLDWMSHTRPDPPALQMLADQHFETPDELVSTHQWQQQRQAPDLASLRFASQGEALSTTPETSQPEPDPLACWDPNAAPPVEEAAPQYVPEQQIPYMVPVSTPQIVAEQQTPYVTPLVEAAPQSAPEQPIPHVVPLPEAAPQYIAEQQAPYVAPLPEAAPQLAPEQPAPQLVAEQPAPYTAPVSQAVLPHPLMAPQPGPVMFPGADMDVDASLEEDIDLYLYGKKRRWPWVVALVALVVAMGVAALILTRQEPVKPWAGQVEVVSLPSGATVAMDGKSLGTTPLKVPLTRPGSKHKVIVTLQGHKTWKDEFAVSQEQPSVRLLAILD